MKVLFRNILVMLCAVAAVSCYKDQGNYDYKEINEIVITSSSYTYATGSERVLTLEPEVSQTITKGTENLSYEWKMQNGASWDVVGNGPSYDLQISADDSQPFNFRFAVTDVNLGITTYAEITVNPVSGFDQCWFLLQDVGGRAVLGSVSGEGEAASRAVTPEQNIALSGEPRFLGIHPFMNIGEPASPEYLPLLGVFTSDEQYILNGFSLQPHTMDYDRIVYGKKFSGMSENVPVDNGIGPQVMKGQRNGFGIIDGGTLWYAVPDQYAVMYPVKVAESGNMFDYVAEDFCLSYSIGYTLIMYDSKGTRFLFYDSGSDYGLGLNNREEIAESGGSSELYLNDTQNNRNTLKEITGKATSPNAFDPDDIPAGFVIDDMSVSTGNRYTNNVMAIGHVGSTFHVYEFCMEAINGRATTANCSASWEVPVSGTPVQTESGKIPATTSRNFTRQFFYAAGNSIYKVDLTQPAPAPVLLWSSENSDDVITGLKFKSDNADIAYDVGADQDFKDIISHLGAIVRHTDGSCDLTEFTMTTGGEIERLEDGQLNIQTFSGFTNVVDFVFSYREYLR